MATFPALNPSSRTFSPGRHPHSQIPTMDGLQGRVRTSNVILDQRLRLTFNGLTEAQMLSIRDHYIGQQGRFLSFAIPNQLLSGTASPSSFTPTGYSWTYAQVPQVTDVVCGRYDVSVELSTVPPEGANVAGANFDLGISFAAVTPMAETISLGITGGAASANASLAGLAQTLTTTFEAGAASGGSSNVFTWQTPDTANPPANAYRLYASGFARLSTTTSGGYKKNELLAGLTLNRPVSLLVNSVTHTGTVAVAGVLDDANLPTERIAVTFGVSPAFQDTATGHTSLVLTLL